VDRYINDAAFIHQTILSAFAAVGGSQLFIVKD
jgi:hypothetical protein